MSKNAEGKSQRSFVVENEVWYAALASTKANETTVSAVIRDALIEYTATHTVSAAALKKTAAESRAKGAVSEAAKVPVATPAKAPAKAAAKKAAVKKAPTDAQLAKATEVAIAKKAASTVIDMQSRRTRSTKTSTK